MKLSLRLKMLTASDDVSIFILFTWKAQVTFFNCLVIVLFFFFPLCSESHGKMSLRKFGEQTVKSIQA